MAFKTIVIHFNDEARAPALAAAAVDLGQRSEAHLLGLYAVPPVPVGKGFAGGIIEAGLATYRAEAQRIAEAFRAATGGRSVAAEWRLVESRHRDVADSVITAARTADLVVVAESDPGGPPPRSSTSRSASPSRPAGRRWSCRAVAQSPSSAGASWSRGTAGARRRGRPSMRCRC